MRKPDSQILHLSTLEILAAASRAARPGLPRQKYGEGPLEYSRKMLGTGSSIQGIQAEYSVGSEKVDRNNFHKRYIEKKKKSNGN